MGTEGVLCFLNQSNTSCLEIAPGKEGESSGPGVGVFDDFFRLRESGVALVEGEGDGLRLLLLLAGFDDEEAGRGGGDPTGDTD
jgi:hypothetical protein